MTWLWLAALGVAPQLQLPPECAAADPDEVARAVAVELSAEPVRGGGEVEHVAVIVTCQGDQVGLRAGTLQRVLDLSRVPVETRARTIALAAAELARLSAGPELRPGPPATSSRLLIEAAGSWLGRGLWLWGGGLRFSWEPSGALGLEVDARLEHGAVTVAAGQVVADRATVGLAGHLRWTRDCLALRGGVGLRAGGVRLSGQTALPGARASSGIGGFLGLTVGLAFAIVLGPVSLELALEGGLPIGGPVALVDGAQVAGANGPTLGSRLGVGLFP